MSTFLTTMTLHLVTTALGALYVYRRGATPVNVAVVATWAILFFPVAFNVAKFL